LIVHVEGREWDAAPDLDPADGEFDRVLARGDALFVALVEALECFAHGVATDG
jgi:hypothetical protein